MEKNLFGFEVNCNDDLHLTLPDMGTFKRFRSQFIYSNKDFFWIRIKPIINYLAEFKSVVWEGNPDMQIEACTVTRHVRERKYAALKDQMVDFFSYFFSVDSNILKIIDCMITPKGLELGKEIVDKGAVCLADIPERFSWTKYKATYWGDNMDPNTRERWEELKDTAPLAMMSHIMSGPAPSRSNPRAHYTPNYPFILPDYKMLQFIIAKAAPDIEITEIPDPKALDLTLFSGDDLFGNEETLQSLIISGILAAGKSKIGISAIKKLNNYIPLKQFPPASSPVMSRQEYVANAAFLTFGEPSDLEFPDKNIPDAAFLKAMYGNIQVNCRYYLSVILANNVKGLTSEFFYLNKRGIQSLFNGVAVTLFDACNRLPEGWVEYNSFCWGANFKLSLDGFSFIYPDDYAQRPDSVKDVAGKPMDVSDFKKNIHDVILRAMIEGMAAIGGADLLYDNDGNIAYLRLSKAGKWYLGITTDMPESKAAVNVEESIEVDDQTGLIIIKNPAYPYATLLPEFADKMTDTRYCFSEKVFLKKCDNPEMLDSKVKRFKRFILTKPGPRITERINMMMANCNLVKKTTGGSTFQLLDIDPKNSRLHNLIVDNKEIKKNSLRVEGCRLLVKTKFLPRFFEILTENGYLNEIANS